MQLSSVSTNINRIIFQFNVIIVRLKNMLLKISIYLCVFINIIVIKRNLILCIDFEHDVVVFTRYRMTNMSGQLSQCRNYHQAGKPGVAF